MATMVHPAALREAQLAAAISLHQQGQLDAAEAAYAALLKRQPRHFDGRNRKYFTQELRLAILPIRQA